jgi:hypothetical protein
MSESERLDELEHMVHQITTAVMSLERIVFNLPRRPCMCPACVARRKAERDEMEKKIILH